jgi:hypothetical protein
MPATPSIINNPYAHMGYVGSVQFRGLPSNPNPVVVRVTSCDIKASQDITYPEVIDGRIDTTLYQIAPIVVGGNMAFPLVHEGSGIGTSSGNCTATSDTLAKLLWQIAAERDGLGRMNNTFFSDVRYADNTAFTYPGCMVNQMTFTVTQGEAVTVSSEVFGGIVSPGTDVRAQYAGLSGPTFLSPARVVTWNDAQIELYDDNGQVILKGNELREFTAMINNGLERVYTMNGTLGPQDIAPKKREISGTMKIMGMNQTLDQIAYNNQNNFTTKQAIAFGYTLGSNQAGAIPYWATAFFGVIYKLEEMALTTGIFETTTNWRAMGDCDREFLATSLGTSKALSYPSTGAGGGYGGSTAPNFPSF